MKTDCRDNYKDCATYKIGNTICGGMGTDDDCGWCPIYKPVPEPVLDSEPDNLIDPRDYNVGASDYSEHGIQPWDIWLEYKMNPWDADIIKRMLRTKDGDSRKLDYQKIKHICDERIRQIDAGNK